MQDPAIRAVVELPGAVTGDARFEQMLAADVFVFASYYEGQPTVLLEAMSTGLPIVTTDEGAIRDTIVDGETGYLVPKRDPAAIARRVIELLQDGAAASADGRGRAAPLRGAVPPRALRPGHGARVRSGLGPER